MPDNKKIALLVLAFVINLSAHSQGSKAVTKTVDNGVMASQGKIYVVMAIVMTILAGLIVYVWRLDRKMTRLEKGEGL